MNYKALLNVWKKCYINMVYNNNNNNIKKNWKIIIIMCNNNNKQIKKEIIIIMFQNYNHTCTPCCQLPLG